VHLSRVDVQHIGALAALVMAGIYYLIGLGVLNVGGTVDGGSTDSFGFGVGAGTAFLIVAALLLFTDKRWIWVLALGFQVLVFVIYVAASGIRVPPFEIWGITLRTIQVLVIGCLVYLAVDTPKRTMEARS
jgi:hypothetical protein